jgi:hypothetical protein
MTPDDRHRHALAAIGIDRPRRRAPRKPPYKGRPNPARVRPGSLRRFISVMAVLFPK